MGSIKKMLFVLAGLLVFLCFPVLAQDTQGTATVSVKADEQADPTVKAEDEVKSTPTDKGTNETNEAQKSEITVPENSTVNESTQESQKEMSKDVNPMAEVFIDSNALNSKISIEVNDEVVSGPGNKVLAVIPVESSFKVVTEPAEGSETMAMDMKLRDLSGEVVAFSPTSEEGNVQTYQLPANAEGVSGAVFFGNTSENSYEEAKSFVSQNTNESATKLTIVDSEKKIVDETPKDSLNEETSTPVADVQADSPTTNSNDSTLVSETTESPETGIEDAVDWIPVFLTAMMIASVTLWSRKKMEED